MAKQKIKIITTKIRKTINKSQLTTDSKGRKHCGTCGAYVGNRGKKSVKTQ